MTQEEKNKRLAQACGVQIRYFRFSYPRGQRMIVNDLLETREEAERRREFHASWGATEVEEYEDIRPIPNYFLDLNACHEAEKILSYEQHCKYADLLDLSVGGPAYRPGCRAAAHYRAEVLGLTLKLWEAGE